MRQTAINGSLVALFILGALQALAGDKLELTLRVESNLSVPVKDGQKIGSGEVRAQDAHTGYWVWLDAPTSGDTPNQYVIHGKNDARHELRVAIGQAGWVSDSKAGKGIIKLTSEVQAYFDIVADGNQTVPADKYQIAAQGSYLTP